MGVRFYDEALVSKIQNWIKDPNMVILKPNEVSRLWQIRADQKNDKPLRLPLVAVSRQPNINMAITSKRALSFDGVHMDNGENLMLQLNAIPIEIKYQIDIYTKRYEEGDEYFRNFVYNFVNHPKMKILIPYNDSNIEHVCYIKLDPEASDNSDVPEKLFADEFTRWTLNIEVTDAYLFSVPVKEIKRIESVAIDVVTPECNDHSIEDVDLGSNN